eukprot:10136432-Alexandrium_andersonii.AAC.1
MEWCVDVAQAIPVIGPWSDKWPGTVYHGTRSDAVMSIVQNGPNNRLAWGGKGTDRTRCHFVRSVTAGQQAGLRTGSGAVVVVDLDLL